LAAVFLFAQRMPHTAQIRKSAGLVFYVLTAHAGVQISANHYRHPVILSVSEKGICHQR